MITIMRRLHDGIYRSSGGGETRTVLEWKNTNPRNLVAAAKLWKIIHRESIECYGDIGCGRCWIEIDGVELDSYEAAEINDARERRTYERALSGTATSYAAKVLTDLTREASK